LKNLMFNKVINQKKQRKKNSRTKESVSGLKPLKVAAGLASSGLKTKSTNASTIVKRKSKQRKALQLRKTMIKVFVALSVIVIGILALLEYPQKILHSSSQIVINKMGDLGFIITEVFIEGRKNADINLINQAINLKENKNPLSINIQSLKEELTKIGWIKDVQIQIRLPNLLYIKVIERTPIALWQHQKKIYLIDKDGVVIESGNNNSLFRKFGKLFLIIGSDAPSNAPTILNTISKFPRVRESLKILTRIRKRRWNVITADSVTVKLSEESPEESLAKLDTLLEQGKINKNFVSVVDLRNQSQIILKPSSKSLVFKKSKGKEA